MQFTSHIKSFKKILQKVSLPLLGIAIFGFGVASIVAQSSQPEPVLGFAWNGNAPTPTHLGCLKLSNGGLGVIVSSGSGTISTTSGSLPGQPGSIQPGTSSNSTDPTSVSTVLPGCGLGWIGMNSQTPGLSGISGSSPFIWGVSLDMISGALSGYAFARSAPDPSNPGNDWVNTSIGWITFNSPSSGVCPDSPSNCAPKVNLSTGKVTGWIRVCSVLNQGCSGSSGLHPQAGGWDGWIKLSDDNPSLHYVSPNFTSFGGVTYSAVSGDFCGFAWGGPVGGWIDFGSGPNCSDTVTPTDSCPNINGDQNGVPSGYTINSDGDCVLPCPDCGPTSDPKKLSLSASPNPVNSSPFVTTLTWASSTQTDFESCQVMGSNPDASHWDENNNQFLPAGLSIANGWDDTRSGVEIPSPVGSSTSYTILCTMADGHTETATAYAYRDNLTASVNVTGPGCLQQSSTPPDTTDINWTATANVNVGSCVFSSNAPDGSDISDWNLQNPGSNDHSGGLDDFPFSAIGTYSFTLTCNDINSDPVPPDTLSVSYQPQACSISGGGAPRPRFEEN